MKTKSVFKMGITSALLVGALVSSQAWNAPAARADDGGGVNGNGNPFGDGTTAVRLTAAEKKSLMQYADNSNAKLQDALNQAQGMGFQAAAQIYLKAIKGVVIDSFQDAPRSELLMRVALNQALELTYGVPTSDGKTFAQPGVLQNISNQDLLSVILEDSIKLAQQYYQDDRTAIQKGTLLDLPYMQLAEARLTLARQWMASILDPTAIYEFEVTTLQQFMNTAAAQDQQHRAYYAEELTHVDDLLGQYSMQVPSDSSQLMSDVRVLRGEMKSLEASVGQKLSAEGQPVGQVPTAGGAVSSGSNNLGMNFVAIQPGTFQMGSPQSEESRGTDETQHEVTITHSFQMETTDVTQAQWIKAMGANPSSFQSQQYCQKTFAIVNGVQACPDNPVEQVSWYDAQRFIQKLNSTANDGYTYRLPTEAEWEYSARAGTTTAYYFGNDPSQLGTYGWYAGNSGNQTHEVAHFHRWPNSWGLYDMAGNVWQWVQDWYGDYSNSRVTDPTGPSSGSNRVLRGGCWYDDARYLRSAIRDYFGPDGRDDGVGFRLVRTSQ